MFGKPEKGVKKEQWDDITDSDFEKLELQPHKLFYQFFNESELQSMSKQTIICIEQVRAKCHSNIYFSPEQVIKDITRIIAWNQIFRTKTSASFIYLSNLYEAILQIINKRKFHKKFFNSKLKDYQKLMTYENSFKVEPKVWPYVPQCFREYEELDHYDPTPKNRSELIENRLKTHKAPQKCPENCVCLSEQTTEEKQFCSYTLKDGWISACPNRANKIQCLHEDPEEDKRCRNSQIRKSNKKLCKKTEQQSQEHQEIEECIIWGIDLFTRNLIFSSLPESDLDFITNSANKNERNKFIEQCLLKAINFNGKEGYDFQKACIGIIGDNNRETSSAAEENIQKNQQKCLKWKISVDYRATKSQKLEGQSLFSEKDRYYAQILLENYKFCMKYIDKTLFRIHTKGKGARCINKEGIRHGSFLVEYFGQLYEPWRWYQREDFIKQILKKRKLKNFIPQFYNIYLEYHHDDPDGFDLMVVDPVKKGNFSSRFSHSCNPNCGTVATISDGKYYIGMYAFRDIKYGEQLTFDYCCMTESSYEHKNSICLCGMQKCRGNYLQLSNTPLFSQLVDKNTCFHSRNSLILGALEEFTEDDLQLCHNHNIKGKMLENSPMWIKKWIAKLLRFIETEASMYKEELQARWKANYPWGPDQEEARLQKIELYSSISQKQLMEIRFQNLFTTTDKLKYFLNTIQDKRPPLYYIETEELLKYFITEPKYSIMSQIQDILIEKNKPKQAELVQTFFDYIKLTPDTHTKLLLFRLACLCTSHMIHAIPPTSSFNTSLLGDIVYFYAFTHTYFSAYEYKSHVSQEISVCLQQITGNQKDMKFVDKIKKRYSSQFVWGQLVSWYKQTIVSPESSLSQDRRGTLSYPMLKSTINSTYPFEKHCRNNFLRAIQEKPASCWPPAPHDGCSLSFKNPFKCYGTMFFENIHNAHKLESLPGGNLLISCMKTINKPFNEKLELFKEVEFLLESRGKLDPSYDVLNHIEAKFFSFTSAQPSHIITGDQNEQSKKRRKIERLNEQS